MDDHRFFVRGFSDAAKHHMMTELMANHIGVPGQSLQQLAVAVSHPNFRPSRRGFSNVLIVGIVWAIPKFKMNFQSYREALIVNDSLPEGFEPLQGDLGVSVKGGLVKALVIYGIKELTVWGVGPRLASEDRRQEIFSLQKTGFVK